MASFPVYLLTLTGKIVITYITYKAVEKLTREYSWFSSSAAHGVPVDPGADVVPDPVDPGADVVPDRRHARNWYPSPSVAPVVSVDTGATVVHDRVSSTEDAPVSVETPVEEFRSAFGLEENNKDNEDEDDDFNEDNIELDSLVREAKDRTPDAICYSYLVNGTCRNGSNCGYTHLPREEIQVIREKEKENLSEKMEQQECKYYLRPGGCKFGKDCRYSHSREKPVVPPLDFNFLGLPIRPGERECRYYMRTSSCKYGPNCRFHHPDPTAVGEGDVPSGSFSLHPSGVSQSASTSWSSPPNETAPCLDSAKHYVPVMPPPQGVHQNPEWNGYQASLRSNGPNTLGWNKPKTNPAVNGTKIVQSAWCEICNIDCKSNNVLFLHELGKKHKMNLEKLEEPKTDTSAPAATTAPAAKDPAVGPKESPAADKGNTVGMQQNKEKGAPSLEPGKDLETLIVQSAWCEICKIDCISKNILFLHELGKKHEKSLEKLEESKKKARANAAKHSAVGLKESPAAADKGKTVSVQQGKEKGAPSLGPEEDLEIQRRKLMEGGAAANALWLCTICNVMCDSQTVFTDHLAGQKHASNMVKEQVAVAGTTNPSDPLGGFYFIEDELL
ncbi:hypothetical protein NE237_019812 [Protea cynaroides]|uniref:C3H1-type domain-containing protein n=1 Tax=Protea cynaroides TaxID=273540 RepID=A0A9Q0H4V3_9MAGN|nr:hypothetical protein NE237_019812 [Protea cynaroides]